ncbi:hypothetical protein JOB18_007991 [Solea senegalensis]|uniref:Uncharacterized protein n=1 Tax=Solea senegalensis TaxID=28829 RepID=A0AAV6SPL4_SOLSE|nr:hypothetical protein JOB18_007991 [Solea senegalensis]
MMLSDSKTQARVGNPPPSFCPGEHRDVQFVCSVENGLAVIVCRNSGGVQSLASSPATCFLRRLAPLPQACHGEVEDVIWWCHPNSQADCFHGGVCSNINLHRLHRLYSSMKEEHYTVMNLYVHKGDFVQTERFRRHLSPAQSQDITRGGGLDNREIRFTCGETCEDPCEALT